MEFHYPDNMETPNEINDSYLPDYAHSYVVNNPDADYQVKGGVLVDGGDQFGVTAVTFDKYEELIWMGNAGGHVTSYYGPEMRKYTSFQVHMTEEIRDIITDEQSLYILSKSQLRHQIRRGLPKHTHTSQHMTQMQCLFQSSKTKLLMGGHQDTLIEYDVEKCYETVVPITEDGCAVLRSGGGSLVACGSANGTVTLRDIRTPCIFAHKFKAHTGCLSDLDMQGNMLISSGFKQAGPMPVPEQFVVVWDVRHLTGPGARLVPVAAPPLLLHFLPSVSGKATALSSDGHVAILHVGDPSQAEEQSVFQVDTQGTFCSVMDVSSTSQAFVFGDEAGHLHLFSSKHNNEPVFNNFSRATEFATPVRVPCAGFDPTFRFSSVPRAPLMTGNRWFHQMPEEFFKRTYRRIKPIDPEVLRTMQMQGPIGVAPNPGSRRRNQYPYVDDNLEDMNRAKRNEEITVPPKPPKEYQKIDIRYTKNEPNEELQNCNKTGLPGIEATLPNSYCNPMIQILYNMLPLKAALIAHTCAKEFCLTCELGFLFQMLDRSGGVPCQANKFLRAFRTVPEASALGLILPDRPADVRDDLVSLIQSWNRFILHQLHFELLETQKKEKELVMLAHGASPPKAKLKNSQKRPMNGYLEEFQYTELEYVGLVKYVNEFKNGLDENWKVNGVAEGAHSTEGLPNGVDKDLLSRKQCEREDSDISKLFGIARQQLNRCLKCNKEEERDSVVLACALQYHLSREGADPCGLLELIRASLCARRSTPAWCERCARFTPTTQRARITRLPPILAINCGGVSADEKAFWGKNGVTKEVADVRRNNNIRPCRYGVHCARPGCRFNHPERSVNPTATSSHNTDNHSTNCVLPHQLLIRLQTDGEVIINEKNDSTVETRRPVHSEDEYTLTGIVVSVEDSPRHLVAYCRHIDKGHVKWYLYNDLSIMEMEPDEVVHYSVWWKSPCVLFYTHAKALHAKDMSSIS